MTALLTLDDCAKKLGVSRSTVARFCDSGELPSVKLGKARQSARRVRPEDLSAFIRRHRTEGAAPGAGVKAC